MATTTANQALPVPESTDDPNVAEDMTTLALAIEKKLVMVFVNDADRSARVPAPTEGMFAFMKDSNTFMVYDGAAWVSAIGDLPTFSSGAVVPSNATGNDGDVFFKI